MKKILVSGSNGQVGMEIRERSFMFKAFDFSFTDINELDITSGKAVNKFFAEYKPDFLINCAAYTAVDKAETESDIAYKINYDAVENLVLACHNHGTRMFHISTDYVFDGLNNKPYNEKDSPNPLSVYGKSKYKGEQAVLNKLSDAYIIRTSWIYSSYGNNFVKTIIKLASQKDQLNIVADQVGTPTFAGDIADVILKIITNIEKYKIDFPGLYHFSNEGVASWYDFALAIKNINNLNVNIYPIPSSSYPTMAPRPFYSLLDKSKIKEKMGIGIIHWLEKLKELRNPY